MTWVSNGIATLRYMQHHRPGMFLGRHLELDARSLAHLVSDDPHLARVTPKPAAYDCPLPILDQGQLGSCTGNAGTEALAALYAILGADWKTIILAGKTLSDDPAQDEQFAVEVYHEATVNDGFPGTYPPSDTGSSGLGVSKALAKDKLITSYRWATSLIALGQAYAASGAIIGMPWYNAFFDPDAQGFIDHDPHWKASGVAGGHELYWFALESWDNSDPTKTVFAFVQSWGTSWGDHGHGRITGATYNALRHQIDAKQYVR